MPHSTEATVNRAGNSMPNLFARAASLLLGEDPEDSADSDRRLLLQALGYVAAAEFPAGGGEPGPEARHRHTRWLTVEVSESSATMW